LSFVLFQPFTSAAPSVTLSLGAGCDNPQSAPVTAGLDAERIADLFVIMALAL